MTRESFIASGMSDLALTFNANRGKRKRAPRDEKTRNMLGAAWDLYDDSFTANAARARLKAAFFPWSLISIAWWLWGDDLINWIIRRLWPQEFGADPQMPWWLQTIYVVLLSPLIVVVWVASLFRKHSA